MKIVFDNSQYVFKKNKKKKNKVSGVTPDNKNGCKKLLFKKRK